MDASAHLPEPNQCLHWALISALIDEGAIPSPETLAATVGITTADLPKLLQELAAADYVALDDTGCVTCLYPFSTTSTPHVVAINGRRRYAMCAIDALGIPAMLGEELTIEGRCAICVAPIALRVRPGAIVSATPATAQVVACRDEAEPAFAACCPYTLFTCDPDHAERLLQRISRAHAMPLATALSRAEEIFGGLLADPLPARRPRGKAWDGEEEER